MKILALLLICFIAFSLQHPYFVDRKSEKELRNLGNNGWQKIEKASPENTLKIQFAVKQRNLDILDKTFWEVSNPEHPNYGNYLTIDEITEMISPAPETLNTVESWLSQQGILFTNTRNKDIITAYPTVQQAEQLLDVEFFNYMHEETGYIATRTQDVYTVPTAEIAGSLDFIIGHSGLTKVPKTKIQADKAAQMVGPNDLRARYNVTAIGGNPKNSQAVAEFQFQYMSPNDLSQFFQTYYGSKYNDKVTKFVGNNNADAPGVEATLDIEYIMGVAPNVSTWFYSTPSMDFWSDITSWIGELNDEDNAPWVHSISYGDQGESQPSVSYKDRVNSEFQKIGVRGISLLFASGDSGTGCLFCYYFEPSFPATSPYVTSVGATTFINGGVSGPEEATTAFGSGGGFSWHFDIPSYQQVAVKSYLTSETDLPSDHFYNPKGRGTPDVSALGWNFAVLVSGKTQSVGGTSAAAPTFSAVVSLLNEHQLSQGKKTLGFLNQWIYQSAHQNPNTFFDVTQGNNHHGCCGLTGFNCRAGWDPATGVGTPNYPELIKALP